MAIKFLEHTADVKFQADGESVEKVFSEAALALKQTIASDVKVVGKIEKKISVSGNDFEGLLYNFLEEILFLLDTEDFLIANVKEIKIDEKSFKINAILVGDLASKYKFANNVKAITYNEMFVKKQKDKFICQVVLDV